MFLITGATGNTGSAVAYSLEARGLPVRELSRAPRSSASRQVVVGDLNDPASIRDALRGVDGVFLLPGYADMAGLAKQIRAAGVPRVVLLSGSSAGSGDMSNAITKYMVESERAVIDAGVDWTIVRPSFFMSNALRWLPELRDGDVVQEPFPTERAAVIDPADIGEVVATILTSAGEHAGQTYRITGPESLGPAQRLAILARALQRPLKLVGLTPEQAQTHLSKTMPPAYVDAFVDFYIRGSLDESPVLPTVEQLIGRAPATFGQWVARNVEAFR